MHSRSTCRLGLSLVSRGDCKQDLTPSRRFRKMRSRSSSNQRHSTTTLGGAKHCKYSIRRTSSRNISSFLVFLVHLVSPLTKSESDIVGYWQGPFGLGLISADFLVYWPMRLLARNPAVERLSNSVSSIYALEQYYIGSQVRCCLYSETNMSRDDTSSNIMMDKASVYRVPFHPIQQDSKCDCSGSVRPYRTPTQPPVKYSLVDLGATSRRNAHRLNSP